MSLTREEYKHTRYLEELQNWLHGNHPTIISEFENSNDYKKLMKRLDEI